MRSAEENVALSTWFTLFTFPDGDAISELSRCLHRKLDRKGRKVLLGAGQGRWVQLLLDGLLPCVLACFTLEIKSFNEEEERAALCKLSFFEFETER